MVLANGVWFANPGPEGDPEIDAWTRDEIDATTAHDIVLADLDDDGDLDVVKRHPGAAGDVIRVFRQDGGSTWTERTIPATAGEGLALGDHDADGDPDIVIAAEWYENDGDPIGGAWTPHTYSTTYTHPNVVVKVGDVGGSSRPDIVLTPAEAAGGSYRVSWFEAPADPEATWPEHVLLDSVESVVHSLALADFDRNGRTDVALTAMHQGADPDLVRVLLQDAADTFSSTTVSSQGSHNLAAGDIDGDGRVDLFGANHNSGQAPDGAQAKLWLNRTVPEPAGALLSLTSLGVLAHLCARRRRRQQQCVAGSPSVPITAIMASAPKGLRWRAMPPGDCLGNGGGRSDPARLPSALVAVRYPDRASRRERLELELARILTRIVDADTERVILFGSAARGDVKSTSDLDLLVVRRDARRPAERAADLYRRAQPSLAVDILVYTPEELDAARETSSFIRRILREGRVVHDRSRAVA
ncbi:MAG: repeat protein [Proteobacteria bacterium]|nr:repeat protein [Pseudomonadota bacterium]